MVDNISVFQVWSYIKFINLIKNVPGGISGKIPGQTDTSTCLENCFSYMTLELKLRA